MTVNEDFGQRGNAAESQHDFLSSRRRGTPELGPEPPVLGIQVAGDLRSSGRIA